MEGEDYFENTPEGHFWVAKHIGYHTLTFEPKVGGQYEIAVRILSKDENGNAEWQGYYVEFPLKNCLFGVNTRGH